MEDTWEGYTAVPQVKILCGSCKDPVRCCLGFSTGSNLVATSHSWQMLKPLGCIHVSCLIHSLHLRRQTHSSSRCITCPHFHVSCHSLRLNCVTFKLTSLPTTTITKYLAKFHILFNSCISSCLLQETFSDPRPFLFLRLNKWFLLHALRHMVYTAYRHLEHNTYLFIFK